MSIYQRLSQYKTYKETSPFSLINQISNEITKYHLSESHKTTILNHHRHSLELLQENFNTSPSLFSSDVLFFTFSIIRIQKFSSNDFQICQSRLLNLNLNSPRFSIENSSNILEELGPFSHSSPKTQARKIKEFFLFKTGPTQITEFYYNLNSLTPINNYSLQSLTEVRDTILPFIQNNIHFEQQTKGCIPQPSR